MPEGEDDKPAEEPPAEDAPAEEEAKEAPAEGDAPAEGETPAEGEGAPADGEAAADGETPAEGEAPAEGGEGGEGGEAGEGGEGGEGGPSEIAQRIEKDPLELEILETELPESVDFTTIPKINDARGVWRLGMRKIEECFAEHIANMHLDFEDKAIQYEKIESQLQTNH